MSDADDMTMDSVRRLAAQDSPLPQLAGPALRFLLARIDEQVLAAGTDPTSRVAFEHWYSDGWKTPKAVVRSGDGYAYIGAQSAWIAWQAAAAYSAQLAKALRSIHARASVPGAMSNADVLSITTSILQPIGM